MLLNFVALELTSYYAQDASRSHTGLSDIDIEGVQRYKQAGVHDHSWLHTAHKSQDLAHSVNDFTRGHIFYV